jgi:hypothetical protein
MKGDLKSKAIEVLLIILFSRLLVFPQTTETCRVAVQHLTLPSTVESPAMHPAQPLTPIKFLFSVEGKDVYLATALRPPYPWSPLTDQPLSLLLVYQDEKARQEAITFLHNMGSGGMLLKESPPLDNLKFAAVHCKNTWDDFVSTGGCTVNDWQYYEPQACIVMPTADDPASLSKLAMLNPRNRFDVMNNFNWLNGFVIPPGMQIPKLKFPMEKIKKFTVSN